MGDGQLTPGRRRVLELIKRLAPVRARELATRLEMSDAAIRQHLGDLDDMGLVQREEIAPASGRGRPAGLWGLTPAAAAAFPDGHAELTIGLVDAIRNTVGEKGLRQIIDHRARDQIAAYERLMPSGGRVSLRRRVDALARQRTAEGYMAEVVQERSGVYLLIEHHCPICEAASSCTRLCQAELEVFRAVLGEDVSVERTRHLLSNDERCVYRIRRASG